MICGARSLVNSDEGGGAALKMRCRAWTCPECAPERARKLCAFAAAGKPQRLITLTASAQAGQDPAARAAVLANAWRLVVKRGKRRWPGQPWEYLAVFEATVKGEPHLHILARCPYLPQRWLSDQMRGLAHSPIVDVRRVYAVGNVARYVAKYIGKDPTRFGTCKRYWSTRGYNLVSSREPPQKYWLDTGWHQDDRPLWIIHQELLLDAKGPHQPEPWLVWWGDPGPHLAWCWERTAARCRAAGAAPDAEAPHSMPASRPRAARVRVQALWAGLDAATPGELQQRRSVAPCGVGDAGQSHLLASPIAGHGALPS